MATIEKKIKVHTLTAEVYDIFGKTYTGSMAFGAESWAAKADDPNRDELAREAAFLVAIRHAESMGARVDQNREPRIIAEVDEVLDVEIEASE